MVHKMKIDFIESFGNKVNIRSSDLREKVLNDPDLIQRMFREVIDSFSVSQITIDSNGLVVIENEDYAKMINQDLHNGMVFASNWGNQINTVCNDIKNTGCSGFSNDECERLLNNSCS